MSDTRLIRGISLNYSDIEATIKSAAYHQFPGTTMIVCALTLTFGGHIVIGYSRPIDDKLFNETLGKTAARDRAVAHIWDIAAVQVRIAMEAETWQGPQNQRSRTRLINKALGLAASDTEPTPKVVAVASTTPDVEDDLHLHLRTGGPSE